MNQITMASFGSLAHGATLPPLRSFHAETIDDCYLAGQGLAMQKVRSQLLRIAPYVRMALIVGEPGTGKQAIARALHDRSAGSSGPFVVRHAATFVDALASEAQNIDALREAHGGTLFLHKICGLPAALQSRLLRLLHLHEELRSQRCDLRIVGSSQRDLRTLATSGNFHEELYRRIAAVEITVPPLSKRPEDLLTVVKALLFHLAGDCAVTPESIICLQQHRWIGNIRELQEVLENAARLADGAAIRPDHLQLQDWEKKPASTIQDHRLERLQDVVQRHVLEVLTHCSGNKLRASEMLGISRSTLYRMLDNCTVVGDFQSS